MKKHIRNRLVSIVLTGLILLSPLNAVAQESDLVDGVGPTILITEVQAGSSKSASEEFIELYNRSTQTIDLAQEKWTIEIASSSSKDWSKAKRIELKGKFYPGAYLLLTSNYQAEDSSKPYLQDHSWEQFSSGLTYSAGHIRLIAGDEKSYQDSLEWSTLSVDGKLSTEPIASYGAVALDKALEGGKSLKRKLDITGRFLRTTRASDDFITSNCPSPTAVNIDPAEAEEADASFQPTTIDTTDQACLPVEDDTDSQEGGLTQPTENPPAVLLPSESITTVQTTTKKGIPAADIGLKSPQLSELLPNPKAPQTDANDEFIELYNSNEKSFDLSGFQLEVGMSRTEVYTFPDGTAMEPKTFKAFYSADTNLSLSNTESMVKLRDPLGNIISQTQNYTSAKDGQAWVLGGGAWQWTTEPTPNAVNAIKPPTAKSGKKTAQKSKPIKDSAATNKSTSKENTENSASGMASISSGSPLHPGVLAVMAGFALLYGAYEYRRDLANKIYQLRSYRAARQQPRPASERRGSAGAD